MLGDGEQGKTSSKVKVKWFVPAAAVRAVLKSVQTAYN